MKATTTFNKCTTLSATLVCAGLLAWTLEPMTEHYFGIDSLFQTVIIWLSVIFFLFALLICVALFFTHRKRLLVYLKSGGTSDIIQCAIELFGLVLSVYYNSMMTTYFWASMLMFDLPFACNEYIKKTRKALNRNA